MTPPPPPSPLLNDSRLLWWHYEALFVTPLPSTRPTLDTLLNFSEISRHHFLPCIFCLLCCPLPCHLEKNLLILEILHVTYSVPLCPSFFQCKVTTLLLTYFSLLMYISSCNGTEMFFF